VEDFNLSRCCVRVFTPEESRPEPGWPVLIFFHGGTDAPHGHVILLMLIGFAGGWTLGNIDTANAFCTKMCKGKGLSSFNFTDLAKLVRCQMRCCISRL
jgi:hypothetical protein